MNEDNKDILVGEEPMTCVAAKEAVTCSPLTATVNTYSLILEGRVGFDQRLEYTAKIPVTPKMVSSSVYEYLEGTVLTIPIGGTIANPTLDRNFVQRALGDLIRQAGQSQLEKKAGDLLQRLFQ
jgi:hypothetical protein